MNNLLCKVIFFVAILASLGMSGFHSNWGPFTFRPGPESTAYFVNGNKAMKHTVNGKRMCLYMDDVELLAEEEICPDIVIRHLATVDIYYDGKECETTCGYDNNMMYRGEMIVYDRRSCPDILVTMVGGGRIDVVMTKYFELEDRAWMYYDTTKTFHWELATDEAFISKCMDSRYKDQIQFYELFGGRKPKARFSR